MKRTGGPFMTVPEVAAELRVSRAHAYRLVVLGRVPAVRRGRSVLVPRAAWSAWLEGQTETALKALRDAHAQAEAVTG